MTNQHKHKLGIIILAAGKGTRMRSQLPKVMHKLAGRSMIEHVLAAAAPLGAQKTVMVLAPGMDEVKVAVQEHYPHTEFATQNEQKGTGHAVRCAMNYFNGFDGTILVLYGDTPLIHTATLEGLLTQKDEHQAAIALLGMKPVNPTGYGRLVMVEEPWVEQIVECKDATPEEKRIPWVWGGVMAFDSSFLHTAITQLKPSPVTDEYYLTKLVEMADERHLRGLMVPMAEEEAMGINSREQLARAEAALQQRLRMKAMENGATLVAPETVFFAYDTKLAADVTIHPHVVFGPGVTIEYGTEIKSFSHLEGAHIEKDAVVGPYARLRPGSRLGEGAHVGNFVELKKTTLAKGAKANHLTYLGDTDVGAYANIGAGTITCNYNGLEKFKTVIGEEAFIGSNSALVAPVTVGDGAMVAAGSVITRDVEPDALAVARGQQVNKQGKAKTFKQRKQTNG